MGDTTVAATTSALAPGYCPETLIVGGAISGYCAMGRRENETAPRMTMIIDTTAAKIGLSMKKCERRMVGAGYFAEAVGVPVPPGAAAPASSGVTLMPGRTRIKPLTTTRESGAKPSRITRWSPIAGPSVT